MLNDGCSKRLPLTHWTQKPNQADASLCLCVQFLIGGLYCYNILKFFNIKCGWNEIMERNEFMECSGIMNEGQPAFKLKRETKWMSEMERNGVEWNERMSGVGYMPASFTLTPFLVNLFLFRQQISSIHCISIPERIHGVQEVKASGLRWNAAGKRTEWMK